MEKKRKENKRRGVIFYSINKIKKVKIAVVIAQKIKCKNS